MRNSRVEPRNIQEKSSVNEYSSSEEPHNYPMDVEGASEDNDIHNSPVFPGLNVTRLHGWFFFVLRSHSLTENVLL